MSPEILARKLAALLRYMEELSPYEKVDFKEFMRDHYKIERLIELITMIACDMVFHFLAHRGEPPPSSYRAAFLRAGELEILSEDLSRNLAQAVGLRNILVHDYDELDYSIVHKSIPLLLRDIRRFQEELIRFL